MDDCFGVKKLIELIFDKKFEITPEMTEPGSNFPACLLVNDFPAILDKVLFARTVIIGRKWFDTFDSYISDVLPTQESYLKYLIHACYNEQYCQHHTFDKFISMCSFVGFFRHLFLRKKKRDFNYLNSVVVLELYKHSLQKSFQRGGGFLRLLEYIREHKYLSWNWVVKNTDDYQDMSSCCDPTTQKNIHMELTTEFKLCNSINKNLSVMKENTRCVTRSVLLSLAGDLPSLEGSQRYNQAKGVTRLQDPEKTAEEKRQIQAGLTPLEDVSQGNLNQVSKTFHEEKEKTRCEVTVQAVMGYNHEKASDLESTKSSVLKEAEEILEHSKDSIKSAINLLDEYDKAQMI